MPQMAPLMWLMLFFIFIITFLLFNMLNYFNFLVLNKNTEKKMMKKDFNLIWKW